MKIFEKFITDRIAIIILVLAAILIPAILYFGFHITPLSIFNVLIIVPNIAYTWIKDIRQKILFKKSSTAVTAKKGPKVLFWILDGCNVQAFLDVAKKNSDLKILFDNGYFAQCVTIFPSITPAAHSTIITGCYPAKTRVPAFDWVEVESKYSGTENREYIRVMPDFKRFQQEMASSKYQKEFFQVLEMHSISIKDFSVLLSVQFLKCLMRTGTPNRSRNGSTEERIISLAHQSTAHSMILLKKI